MSPARTPRPPRVPRDRPQHDAAPLVRSDESIGRQEDIGSLVPPRPPKPVRFTLDLDQAQHAFLKTWAVHRSVGGAQVLRALLQELEDNPDLAIRIRTRAQAAKR